MLILHQTGSVRVGEVVRYTLTYTPSLDRILPPPSHLYVKIKNTSAIPLRAAYLHGPYTLYVACYPSSFDPNVKQENYKDEGAPQFEPQLKAGGHWLAKLTVPEEVRKDAETSFFRSDHTDRKNFTWIIEVASQILFSTTAAVHFEVLVGRDEKSVHLGFHGVVGSAYGVPGRLEDQQQGRSRNAAQSKGVFSKAVRLVVDDTESLWNSPPFPEWNEDGKIDVQEGPLHGDKRDATSKESRQTGKPKKIHLVILTHGLHSNLGADMLFMKETIDTAAKQAREDAKKRNTEARARKAAETNDFGRDATDQRSKSTPEVVIAPTERLYEEEENEEEEEDEQVFVRGFKGNTVKTEKGIQYLGKRLAKYVLSITYPDQPFLPVKSSISKTITRSLIGQKTTGTDGKEPIHRNSSIVKDEKHVNHNLPYKITSISFIGHSLGGLTQTYAIAYIQKHSPGFFDLIKPINFVAMASPFLGLSNENPIYVKFALDFGLVGRTGQDLGLTWRPPAMVRSGWGAMIGGLSNESSKTHKEPDPGSKPLLRILPTGPAHSALKKFRNRTVYSNVVNDGIVPLRTSCLLFLDWRGLGRVEKARRENGLVGTMVGWGWAEMTGQNASAPRKPLTWNDLFSDSGDEGSVAGKPSPDHGSSVPQPDTSQEFDYEHRSNLDRSHFMDKPIQNEEDEGEEAAETQSSASVWSGFLSFFRPQAQEKAHHHPPKHQKIYKRGQAMSQYGPFDDSASGRTGSLASQESQPRRGLVRGSSLYTNNSENGEIEAPPKTTFFESAGDLLNPPLPPQEYFLDPAARPRTIFHDRVYHPDDIPAPPTKRQRAFMRRTSSRGTSIPNQTESDVQTTALEPPEVTEVGAMKIEEKIARAYHKDLSWRKVLVRLEPDAHNNMIVRRMFANAYGWPVIKHMCDTHFAYTAAAQTADKDEGAEDRAKPAEAEVDTDGEEVEGQVEQPKEDDKNKKDDSDGARSVDDFDSTPANIQDVQQDLRKLHSQSQGKPSTSSASHQSRTASEIRESHDDISDLVSRVSATGQTSSGRADHSYSSLNSSKSALSQVARQDSARWSDRFFDSDNPDDSDDDEAYLRELQKAQLRGEFITEKEKRHAKKLSASPKASRSSGKSDPSHSSKGKDKVPRPPLQKVLSGSGQPLVAEPAEMESRPTSREVSGEPEIQPALNLTGVGLGKSVEENVMPESPKDRKGSLGVAEQVAFARAKQA